MHTTKITKADRKVGWWGGVNAYGPDRKMSFFLRLPLVIYSSRVDLPSLIMCWLVT